MYSCWTYDLTWSLLKIMYNFQIATILKKIILFIISAKVIKLES